MHRPSTRFKHLRSSTIRELAKSYPKEDSPKSQLKLPENEAPVNIDIQTPHFISKNNDPLDKFLFSLNLERYIPAFRDNQLTLEDLADLSSTDYHDMGIPIGPRNRILKSIEQKHTENSQETSEDSEVNEMSSKELDDKDMTLKEFEEIVLQISQQQYDMMEAIEESQRAIVRLARDYETEENYTEPYSSRFVTAESERSKSPSRFAQATLSSMAKQRVIPNKYMRVSPLRAAYAQKYLN